MKNTNNNAGGDLFSDNPEENLRIENEILHLKLKAELGGEVTKTQSLPPELENKFLKNILELEYAFANNKQVKIFDFLGRPDFVRSSDLDDSEVEVALKNICSLIESKNIAIDFSESYDARLRYKFITEELFQHETDDVLLPGVVTHYIYEEFHPNHRADIESRAIEFIEGWFDKQVDEESWELGDWFILPGGVKLSKQDVLQKLAMIFASYREFESSVYSFEHIGFELDEGEETGVGVVSDYVSYDAIFENGEEMHVEGNFEIKLSMESRWWSIFYFSFPGFKW